MTHRSDLLTTEQGWGRKIFGNAQIVEEKKPITLSIGNFDGFHLGHKYLIEAAKREANGLPLVVLTFSPHPFVYFSHVSDWYLTTLQEKIDFILQAGASAVVVQEFSHDFSMLNPEHFCKEYLQTNFNIHRIVIGSNFYFGREKRGNALSFEKYFKEDNIKVTKIEPFTFEGETISSTRIRNLVRDGQLENLPEMLGRPYSLHGKIVSGDRRGRTLNFPTANLAVDEQLLIPTSGVYIGYVIKEKTNKRLPAVINIGYRPTFTQTHELRIEAHILDFNEDLYHITCKFELLSRLRSEVKFNSHNELIKQIQDDVEKSREYFKRQSL